MTDIETLIHEKGADKAPRITPADIEATILHETYANPASANFDHRPFKTPEQASALTALSCLTICVLVLQNGFTVVGKSACASPENYNKEIGERIAREDAVRQIWALEGYALRKQLAAQSAAA